MGYVQLIYNPMAGNREFKNYLDYFVQLFGDKGLDVHIYRTKEASDFATFFETRDLSDCQCVFVAGGDGSISSVVNSMKKNQVTCPLGAIPAGTANDFAKHLGLSSNIKEAIKQLAEMKIRQLDLGCVNGQYFVNVCGGGLLVNISQNIDIELKNTLGKLAYYIKGVQELPKFRKIPFRISGDHGTFEEDFYLCLVMNGSSAGGFNRLGELASMKDGLLDFVGLKSMDVLDIPRLFGKILRGDHVGDKNVLYFQGEHITIDCLDDKFKEEETDVDGESGPGFPLDIHVVKGGLQVISGRPADKKEGY